MNYVYTLFTGLEGYPKHRVFDLKKSIEKNSTIPFKFICLTDESILGIDTQLLSRVDKWSSLELLDTKDTVHFISISTVITGNIDFFLSDDRSGIYESDIIILDNDTKSFIKRELEGLELNDFSNIRGLLHHILKTDFSDLALRYRDKILNWKNTINYLKPKTKFLTFGSSGSWDMFDNEHWIKKYY